ncbi:hypothetical protein AWB69_02447 [Caballeronia udeis]|uniref:Uncharacterized protein n=1 Tax=Caballeronia udeis TaxID=1232866 RepID=A0A158GEU7_9BURK|nr:hypothetical protein AWB69_02447 [Caballeronia udeis]
MEFTGYWFPIVCPDWAHNVECFRATSPSARGEATLTGNAPDVDISEELNALTRSIFVAWAATYNAFESG